MRISFNWLKEFVDMDLSPAGLADQLTMAGLEVESVLPLGQALAEIRVGRIVSRVPIPGSDHLIVCRVDVGERVLEIVCGAPNPKEGDKVAVAVPGTVLPGGGEIRPAIIRGVESEGMICSEKELEISDEASGVMILPKEAEIGTSIAEWTGLNDTVLNVELTPNRPDALSHLGVAREISALTGRDLKIPMLMLMESGPEVSSMASVENREPELCPRYAGRVITGVTVGPSPLWMQHRLRAAGVRPINNVVDATNYVLAEWGHPLHAFDYDLLSGHRIVVRRAAPAETLRTLDGVLRALDPSMLVICDAERPVAVAGIMGGENTEVRDTTRRVFLEAACFQPTSVRGTSRKLGLHSESSHRFERGTDVEGMIRALDRAASLIHQLAGGNVARGRIDQYPGKRLPTEIAVRMERVRSLLGMDISQDEVSAICERLSIAVAREERDRTVFRVPTFRVDLTREVDLIEEVARVSGYNRIPSSVPRFPMVSARMTREQGLTALVRGILAGLGFYEVINYSFQHPGELDALGLPQGDPLRSQLRICNPLSEEQSALRTTLVPGVLQTLSHNLKRSVSDVRIFEMGRVFEPRENGLPLEKNRLAGLATGRARPAHWGSPQGEVDFFDVKGILESVLEGMGMQDVQFVLSGEIPFIHPGKSARILHGSHAIGYLGELHPSVMKRWGLNQRVQCFELDLDLCFKEAAEQHLFSAIPRFPSVQRDIAIVLPKEVPASAVSERIRSVEPELTREVQLFDLYQGEPIPRGRKSLAFSIRFQSMDRTLTDEEANRIRDRIFEVLKTEFQASPRV